MLIPSLKPSLNNHPTSTSIMSMSSEKDDPTISRVLEKKSQSIPAKENLSAEEIRQRVKDHKIEQIAKRAQKIQAKKQITTPTIKTASSTTSEIPSSFNQSAPSTVIQTGSSDPLRQLDAKSLSESVSEKIKSSDISQGKLEPFTKHIEIENIQSRLLSE
jgi:hypothetical protein